jgi:hypothetical protein
MDGSGTRKHNVEFLPQQRRNEQQKKIDTETANRTHIHDTAVTTSGEILIPIVICDVCFGKKCRVGESALVGPVGNGNDSPNVLLDYDSLL